VNKHIFNPDFKQIRFDQKKVKHHSNKTPESERNKQNAEIRHGKPDSHEAVRYDSYANAPIKFMASYEYRDDPKELSGR